MPNIAGIRILEKEANKRGDLFTRLMKDLFFPLGYDQPQFDIQKTGREIDIEAIHRTESKRMIAECKATKSKIGGDDINKFVGALDTERRKYPNISVEGYFISLSGFKETAKEQENEVGGKRVILLEGNQVIEELIRGNIIVSEKRAMEQAVHCAAKHGTNLRADEAFELLAHDMGWIWLVYFMKNKQKTHFALIHADGEAIAPEPAQAIIASDKSVGGELHQLQYLPPLERQYSSEDQVNKAREKYFKYLESECGNITLEGLPADQEVGPRLLKLEKIFVPLHLEPAVQQERKFKISTPGIITYFKTPEEQEIPEELEIPEVLDIYEITEFSRLERKSVGGVLSEYTRLAILGAPGAGKTTLIKRLAVAYAFPDRRSLIDDELPTSPWLPIFIRCRQLGKQVDSPVNEILYDIANKANLVELKEAFTILVNRTLQSGNALLLVDGLDEISNEGARLGFVTQLRTFLAIYPNVNIVVTSREAGFRIVGGALSTQCQHYKVADFDNNDIKRLTLSWHKEVMGDKPDVLEEAEKLAKTICDLDRIRQLAKNPLLLTTLLLVKRWVGRLPTRRSVLYGKAVEVLLMTWGVEARKPMEQDETIAQLAFVAFTMMEEGVHRITYKRLKEILTLARRQMPEVLSYARHNVADFITQVEDRSSLLMLSGHEIEDGTLYPVYEFRHLTFQEYLTARAIVEGYYPDRQDEDTPLSILKPHLLDEKCKEVVPLAAVLAGRRVKPLIQHLIEQIKKSSPTPSDHSSKIHIALLTQCLIDEIQVKPQLIREALEWIARRVSRSPGALSTTIISLYESRYGEELLTVVKETYMNSDTDLHYLGGALRDINLYRMGWRGKEVQHLEIYAKVIKLLDNEEEIQKAIGILSAIFIDYYLLYLSPLRGEISSFLLKRLKDLGNKLVPMLYTNKPYLHFAVCWAFAWLGEIGAWPPRDHPGILLLLFNLWKNSPLASVQDKACWAISVLPVMDRELNPFPPPTQEALDFIMEQSLIDNLEKQSAALVMGYYWRKPWKIQELADKLQGVNQKGILGWNRNKHLILKALKAESK